MVSGPLLAVQGLTKQKELLKKQIILTSAGGVMSVTLCRLTIDRERTKLKAHSEQVKFLSANTWPTAGAAELLGPSPASRSRVKCRRWPCLPEINKAEGVLGS